MVRRGVVVVFVRVWCGFIVIVVGGFDYVGVGLSFGDAGFAHASARKVGQGSLLAEGEGDIC